MKIKKIFVVLILLIGSVGASAQDSANLKSLFAQNDEFLDVDDAFKLTVDVFDNEIIVEYKIAPTYYLYQHRLKSTFAGATQAPPLYPDGKKKIDEYFGEVHVYKKLLQLSFPYTSTLSDIMVEMEFQGCAEAGLCYPPTSRYFAINRSNKTATLVTAKDMKAFSKKPVTNWAAPPLNNSDTKTNALPNKKPETTGNTSSKLAAPSKTDSLNNFKSESDVIGDFLRDSNLFIAFLSLVGIGITLAFTPCVFPMMPIISSIITGQGDSITSKKAFFLSLSYTQGVAIPYAMIGLIVAGVGAYATSILQSPPFIIFSAIVFIALAFAMFGFYEIQIPTAIQNKLNNISQNQESGTYIGAGIMGFVSALVVSPCITAPLIAILKYIAETEDPVRGAIYLYGLAVGMGIPLIIIGVGGGSLLPRAGNWMNAIKYSFGVAMIGMALYISKHLIPSSLYIFLWGSLLIITAIYMGALRQVEQGWATFWKGFGIVLLLYGTTLIIGALQGNSSLLNPLKSKAPHVTQLTPDAASGDSVNTSTQHYVDHAGFTLIKSSADLDKYLEKAKSEGKTVMLDYFAEYCVACYEFAALTFPDPRVQAALANTILLQADVTAGDDLDKELMERFKIFGLPSILFFDQDGYEMSQLRAEGFEDAEQFLARIDAAIGE